MAQKSLIGELPKILEEGRREAGRVLERLSDNVRVGLQTNELVLPAKDVDGLFRGRVPKIAVSDFFNAEAQRRRDDDHTDLLTPNGVRDDVSRVSGEQIRVLKTSSSDHWLNRLIYGDNLLVMQALLAGDAKTDFLVTAKT